MKRIYISVLCTLYFVTLSFAQTLNVQVGNVTYQFPASQAGEMPFSDGTTLTVMNKAFTLSEVSNMYVDETAVTDNLVSIVYSSSSASVTVAGNVAQYVTPTISGAHVTIAQSNTDAVNNDEITYQLSGTSSNGSLSLSGSYKCTVSLAGVTLTNPSGAAINITNSKRIQLSAKNGTTNTLTDCASGSQKACVYSKGQLQIQGNGTLNVIGKTKHGIKSASYISIKNLTLNITSTVGDGINCEEYMEIKSGTVTLSGIGDDGIQCDLGGTTSTGIKTDHEDEDTGNIYISGGTVKVVVTAAAAKGIKADGDMYITDGVVTATTSGGGAWDSDELKTKACAGLSADGNIAISGGTLTLTSTGAGGKGISGDGTFVVSDSAVITVKTSGQAVVASSTGTISTVSNASTLDRYSTNYKSSPKGIKIDGAITISGGKISITTSGAGGEGMESKSTLNITGGEVAINAYDDAINSASTLTVSGGLVYARATNNDGIDANGNCYIKGGLVFAVSASSPEVAIDANTEGGYKLYVQGGTIVAIGGLESGASLTQSCYKASSWSKNTWYALTVGSNVFAFKTPSSGGSTMVVSGASTPTLKSGVTASGTSIFDGVGYYPATVSGGSSVSLSSYSGGGGGPGGGGGRW
ncbi:MAG: carbohydrate-binding domain-containing protein [Paludibacteraceae bacterium]|nr:carbohydrate-binding domain-containing protein [Paludibacteraceae bacterium]MBQ6985222.1 carbohydrate-binding domain-containing protein [Paludibacteraceae bacterium]